MNAPPLTPLSTAILLALAEGPHHGYALMSEIQSQSEGRLKPGTGTLYAALARMLDDGLVREVVVKGGDPRRGTSYGITRAGRAAVRAETERMLAIVQRAGTFGLAPEVRRIGDGGQS